MTIRIRLLDTVVEIRTAEPDAARLLTLLWGEMKASGGSPPVRVYEVARDGKGGWIATAGEEVEAIHETLWGVTDALRYRMLELCEERIEGYVTLHAAAVARDDCLVLLAAESGAGKTTLTLALLDAGWTYFTDDLAPIARDTALVHPFPKPLGVKEAAAWERLAFDAGLEPPTGSFLVPPERWRVGRRPLAARALIFPRFAPGTATEVEELTPARAAAIATSYLRRLDPPTVSLVKRVCTGATCARLSYSSSDHALVALDDLLGTIA